MTGDKAPRTFNCCKNCFKTHTGTKVSKRRKNKWLRSYGEQLLKEAA